MPDTQKMTSEQIKQAIENADISDEEPESELMDFPIEEPEEIEEQEETEEEAEPVEVEPEEEETDVVWRYIEQEAQRQEEKQKKAIDKISADVLDRYKQAGLTKIQQKEFYEKLNQLQNLDALDLAERYGVELVRQFDRDMALDKVQALDEEEMRTLENPGEEKFLRWYRNWAQVNKRPSGEREKIIRATSSGPPLKCRATDFLFGYDQEEPQPNPKPKRQAFKMPELRPDEIKEMITDYINKKKRMRR
jgi:hypothetical protein